MKISIIDEDVLYTGQSIELGLSLIQRETIFFSICFKTPFATISINHEDHSSYVSIYCIDNMVDTISEGLKNNSSEIVTASMEPLFTIKIIRHRYSDIINESENKNITNTLFLFTMELDTGKIWKDRTTDSSFSMTLSVRKECIERFVSFLRDIKQQFMLQKDVGNWY